MKIPILLLCPLLTLAEDTLRLSLKKISKETLEQLQDWGESQGVSIQAIQKEIPLFDNLNRYIATFQIGTPVQNTIGLLDIASPTSILCSGTGCFSSFDLEKSSTFKQTRLPNPNVPTDGGGGEDTIQLGNASITQTRFEILKINVAVGTLFSKLGFNPFQPDIHGNPSILTTLFQQKSLRKNILSFYLTDTFDSSELLVGARDRTKFSGKLESTPIKMNELRRTWAMEIVRVDVAGNIGPPVSQSVELLIQNVPSRMPASEAQRIYARLNAVYEPNFGLYVFPCTQVPEFPPVSFKLRDKLTSILLDLKDFARLGQLSKDQCFVDVFTTRESDVYDWILSTQFFLKYYVVFDFDRMKIGLAKSVVPA